MNCYICASRVLHALLKFDHTNFRSGKNCTWTLFSTCHSTDTVFLLKPSVKQTMDAKTDIISTIQREPTSNYTHQKIQMIVHHFNAVARGQKLQQQVKPPYKFQGNQRDVRR